MICHPWESTRRRVPTPSVRSVTWCSRIPGRIAALFGFLLMLAFSSHQAVADDAGTHVTSFTHPSLLHTEDDFARIRAKIQAQESPWIEGWNKLIHDSYSRLDQGPAPLSVVRRGGDGQNYGRLVNEMKKMYALALRWKISGDPAYGDLAVKFMNAWSSTLTEVTGNADRYLAAGLAGYKLANIGEIMRTYDGWAPEDLARFQDMLVNLFYPMNHGFLVKHNDACISNYWANWDLANIAGMMSIGVFADRPDIYNEALDYLYEGEGNGALKNLIFYRHPGNMGQYQESGRDQGHTRLGVLLTGVIAKTALRHGTDLFSYDNYALLSAFEYVAKYNQFEDVPYIPYGANCTGWKTYQGVISDINRGQLRSVWQLAYNQYVNRLGIDAPWLARMSDDLLNRNIIVDDEMGWDTLTETLDPFPAGGAPRGLTAELNTDSVSLSWWGATGADSYTLQRADSPSGPFTTITTVNTGDLLTYTDTDVVAGQDYYYRVTATSSQGESDPSNVVEAKAGVRLRLHLSFDEVTGDQVPSTVGDSAATLVNGPTLANGIAGNAVVLDGVDDYIDLPDDVINSLTDFSVATWVRIDENRDWARLFDFGNGTNRYILLAPRNNSGSARFASTKISYHGDNTFDAPAFPSGRWIHVVLTLKDQTAVLYVDGSEVGRSISGNIRFSPAKIGNLTQNWLGRSQYDNDPYLKGSLDDFRLYSGALSADEVAALANSVN
ncbi:hypothetical protein L861_14625 [Litchfieldella anticariensis FP35 = DSM 16096]|uniref:Fibronectin type-III domain-containing protein n=1 Tax=Litchfieldella anticariensis (strain DSM 16096 / CECT 5854 / CIP 108499 / LMG 22089 / FP35) TaxID=1121939 RepID=S2L5W8_LITA3|nr:LamG-like jellyroll fold domain-containing protein [Halomonas anticariensis]EPC00161.1 hypothetical protein L861_14625 [Halomonas anticariensis FP35 = DSM 16096]